MLSDLESKLAAINADEDTTIQSVEDSIRLLISALERLKSFFLKYKFESKSEEIYFFKNLKPVFVSKLMYYNDVYNYTTNQPKGGEKVLRRFYRSELEKLKCYFDENIEFYRYYRTASTFLDNKYFIRGKYDIKLTLDNFYFQADHRFTTTHDFKVARILANDLLQIYLESEIAKLELREERPTMTAEKSLKWTSSKVALTELIYALHAEGVLNYGKSDLKEVVRLFEDSFGIDLGHYHKTFLEIRERKSERTKFLSSLRDTLIKRMEDADDAL